MTKTIDSCMLLTNGDCPRCGKPKFYHDKKCLSQLPCIRSKPYKLRDGVDLHIGMQVWHVHPYDYDKGIITGMVRFITRGGGVVLWKYVEDRDPNNVFDLAHGGHFTANYSCFSSLENAEKFMEKQRKELGWLCGKGKTV